MTHLITKKTTKKEIEQLTLKTQKSKKGINLDEFCGILKLKESPVQIQKKMRNEWK